MFLSQYIFYVNFYNAKSMLTYMRDVYTRRKNISALGLT